MDIRDRWTVPPDLTLADLEIQAVWGAQAILVRAALLGILGQERADALAKTLSPSAARLLRAAPAADAWVPASDFREILLGSGAIEPLLRSGALARLTAERDADQLPLFSLPGGERVLPGASPRDLAMAIDAIYKARFNGGRAGLDAMEAQEAWVSIWAQDLYPGWASDAIKGWFKRVLEDHYKVRSAVTYVEPPEDRCWWHRYHLRWF